MIIGQIVDRCCVAASNRSVIKYFISRLKYGHKTWKTISRPTRKQIMCDVIERHEGNWRLYLSVTSKGGL